MRKANGNVGIWFLWVGLCLPVMVFAQNGNRFDLKGNNNVIYNDQASYRLDVDLLICGDASWGSGGEIKSINSFVDLAAWSIHFLDDRLQLPDSISKELYATLYDLKNSNSERYTLQLINQILQQVSGLYLQGRPHLTPQEIDRFHQKYDELKSFRILNCMGDRFRLKKSDVSDLKYLEADIIKPDTGKLDFELYPVSDGMRLVRLNGRYGYTEDDSTFSIAPVFAVAYSFSNGLALVGNHVETWFVNKKGVPVLTLTARGYKKIWPFREGYARVQKENELYNFIDLSGREIFAFDFHSADDFSHGMAAVCVNPWAFYNKLKSIRPPQGKQIRYLRKLWGDSALSLQLGIRCGYIEASRFFRIPPIYRNAFSFTAEGRAPVYTDEPYGYLPDSAANNHAYTVGYYSHLIDTNGYACSGLYKSIMPFAEGLLLAECGEGRYGVFSPAGLLLGDCFYGKPVWAGHLLLYADAGTRKYGIMAPNGLIVIPPEYEAIRFLSNSQFELRKDGYFTTVYISPDWHVNKIKQKKVGN